MAAASKQAILPITLRRCYVMVMVMVMVGMVVMMVVMMVVEVGRTDEAPAIVRSSNADTVKQPLTKNNVFTKQSPPTGCNQQHVTRA